MRSRVYQLHRAVDPSRQCECAVSSAGPGVPSDQLATRNQEHGHVGCRVLTAQDGRAGRVGAPGRGFRLRHEKHQMRKPAPILVAQVLLLRHHVAHRAVVRPRQHLPVESGLDVLEHLCLRLPGQDELRLFPDDRQRRSHGGRVEADRGPQLRIPEIGILDSRGPRARHHTYETVLAFGRRLVTLLSENEDLGVLRNGFRGGGPRQRDLGVPLHPILRHGGHAGIWSLDVLCPGRARRGCRDEHDGQHEASRCNGSEAHSRHFCPFHMRSRWIPIIPVSASAASSPLARVSRLTSWRPEPGTR